MGAVSRQIASAVKTPAGPQISAGWFVNRMPDASLPNPFGLPPEMVLST
jgi:hypothetical protein